MRYFHGSSHPAALGTILRGRGAAYEAEWKGTDFYAALETHRPAQMIPHKEAVFMCAQEDIDNCGGSIEIIYELRPQGHVSRHDMNWSSEISCMLADGADTDAPSVVEAARAYWQGKAHDNDQVWEYLARSAQVLRVVEDNRDPDLIKGSNPSMPEP